MVLSYLMTKEISLRENEDDFSHSAEAGVYSDIKPIRLLVDICEVTNFIESDMFPLIHLNINLNALISGRG